jgi:F-type H+-transporting ATPase subunit delta
MQGSLARRYAKAFLDVSSRAGVAEEAAKQISSLAALVEASRDLQVALSNPAIDREKRRAILHEILRRAGARPETRRFVEQLLDRDRLPVLRDIARAFQDLVDQSAGRIRAEVISAQPLDQTRLWRIQHSLETITGKKVALEQRTDPGLIAGIVTKVGSVVYDGSLRTQMQRLRDALLQG